MAEADPDELKTAMKRVAVALKEADVPFALAGGYAAFARGGPESAHDVDFYLCRDDLTQAQKALEKAGLRVEKPAEDWLVKVYDGDAMVDLIHAPKSGPVDHDILDRATDCDVDSVTMPVLSATDLMVEKLLALDEHYCDFAGLFPVVRTLREQIDWESVDTRVAASPFAVAFVRLARDLGLVG